MKQAILLLFNNVTGADDRQLLSVLMSTGIWIAELRELGVRLGHLVVVNGYDINGRLLILDPWEKTRYKMDEETFLQYWTLRGIYIKKL
jgi:ABC-type bacteriocin/lantibiotic exporter with double-glycine peptidase domain